MTWYGKLLESPEILSAAVNTIIVAGVSTVIATTLGTLLALGVERRKKSSTLDALLNNKRPAELPAGGYYLVDPLGNLVLYFRPDLDPSEMVDDIKHLLKLSRIG